jgi:uncharacterized protein YbjT (DUF2867 family)
VRAFVRDPARASERLGDEVELAVGDFADRESLANALVGVERVFLTSANGPQEVEHETAVIDAARAAGVARLVKLSGLGAAVGSPLPALDWHGQIEEHLRRTRLPAVVLQSNFFMTNLLASAEQIQREGKLVAPAAEARISMIDPRDVAAAAASVLAAGGHEGETIVLTGPEAISYERIAAEISTATGLTVGFVDVPEEAARQEMVAAGLPDWLVEHLARLFGIAKQGALEGVTGSVRELIGRKPRAFTDFVRDNADRFGAAQAAGRKVAVSPARPS